MQDRKVSFYSKEIELNLELSVGQYDSFEGEEDLFYIGLFDEDDLCYKYDGFSEDLVQEIFDEIKDKVLESDFYGTIFPETCKLYGLIRGTD